MNIINNKYRILKKINEYICYTAYLVYDILDENNHYQLNVIKNDSVSPSFIKAFQKTISSLKSINTQNIVRILDYNIIQSIDGKLVDDIRYYYLCSYDENLMELKKINELPDLEIINLFIELCQSIAFLHSKDKYHENICFENLMLKKENGSIKLILRDSYTSNLMKYEKKYFQGEDIFELIKYAFCHPQDKDICCLGLLLVSLIDKTFDSKVVLDIIRKNKKVRSENVNCECTVKEKAIAIAMTMIFDKNMHSISHVIDLFNKLFNTNYLVFREKELEQLNFDTDLIDRQNYINNIVESYNSFKLDNNPKKLYVLYGEEGMGKTKLLKAVVYYFQTIGEKVFTNLNMDSNEVEENPSLNIIKRMLDNCPENMLVNQQEIINDILVGMENKEILLKKSGVGTDKIRLIFINRVGAFIKEYCKAMPIILVFDDIQNADTITVDLIKYLCSMNCKAFIVLSYKNNTANNKFVFSRWMNDPIVQKNIIKKVLRPIGKENTNKIIEQILSSKTIPANISKMIYGSSKGNPLLIQEIIKKLFLTNKIYTDPIQGTWSLDIDANDIEIKNIKDTVREQLRGLNGEEIYALQLLSLFKNPVSSKFMQCAKDKLGLFNKGKYNKLVNSMIVGIVFNEDGFTVDFTNKYLKSIVRSTINTELYEEASKIVIDSLEELYAKGDVSVINELKYQAEVTGDRGEIIKYNLADAKLKLDKNYNERALACYERALSCYKKGETDKDKIEIMSNMGLIYWRQLNLTMAEGIYKQAFEENSKLHDNATSIKILEAICQIYSSNKNSDKLQIYINKMEALMDHCDDYHRGRICHLKAIYLVYKGEIKRSLSYCKEALGIIGDKYDSLKSAIYNTMCYDYIYLGETDEAFKYANMAMEYAKKSDDSIVLFKIYTNLTVIYGDYYQDYEKCIYYSKLSKEICEKYGNVMNIINAQNNLSVGYFYNHQYEECLKQIKETQQLISNIVTIESTYCNVIACSSSIILEDMCTSYKAYMKIVNYYDKVSVLEDVNNKLEHYSTLLWFSIWIGDYETTIKNSDKCKSISLNNVIIFSTYIKIFRAMANLFLYKNVEENYEILFENIKNIYNEAYIVNILSRIAKFYILNNRENEIEDFINKNIDFLNCKLKLSDKIDMCAYNLVKSVVEKDLLAREKLLKHNLGLCRSAKLNETYYVTALYLSKLYLIKNMTSEADISLCIAAIGLRKLLKNTSKHCYAQYASTYKLEENFHKIVSSFEYFTKNDKPLYTVTNFVHTDNININLSKFISLNNIRAFKNIYNYYPNYHLSDVDSIVNILNGDDYNNISVLNKYLSHTFFADKTTIISNFEEQFQIINNTENTTQLVINIEDIIQKCKTTKQVIKEYHDDFTTKFCIPIVLSSDVVANGNMPTGGGTDRRKNNGHKDNLVGYIYLEVNCLFEKYVEERISKLNNVLKLIGIVLDKINLRNSAFYDRLTGALTRKYLDSTLKEALENSKKNKQKCSILMLDLDKFKTVNDDFGHQVGDKVLRETSELIRKKIRVADIFGRYGGEELLVVLPNSDANAGATCAEKLRVSIEESRMLGSRRKITVSIGVSCFPEDGQDSIELIEKADKALYIAKNRGRNQVVVWNDEFGKYSQCIPHLSSTVMKTILQEEKRFTYVLDVIKLAKEDRPLKEKLEKVMIIIADVTGSDISNLLLPSEDNSLKQYIRVNDNLHERVVNFNDRIIKEIQKDKKGTFVVDWDDLSEIDPITNLPDWKSILVTPIIYSEEILGIVYLTVSTKSKEFSYEDFSMVNLLLSMATPMFLEYKYIVYNI